MPFSCRTIVSETTENIMKTLNINLLIAIKDKYGASEFYDRYKYFMPNFKNPFYTSGLTHIEAINKALVAGIPGIYLPIL